MQFPMYQVPYLGHGMIIGANGVLHVVVSHGLAIGLFMLIVLTDWMNIYVYTGYDEQWERLKKGLLEFTVIGITVVGAVTGAGIWWTISPLAPHGTSSMLRVFFWPWFTEWLVFVSEVVVVLVFYYRWDAMARRSRFMRSLWGVAYFGYALLSAALITGILGFMLTPSSWPTEREFWPAFFNATFLPQLAARIAFSFTLGAIAAIAYTLFARVGAVVRRRALSLYGISLLLSLVLLGPAYFAYGMTTPPALSTHSIFALLTGHFSRWPFLFWAANLGGTAFVLGLGVAAAMRLTGLVRWMIVPACFLAVGFVAEFERIREFIRGPYLMPGYMYASGVTMEERPLLANRGMLDSSYWYTALRGHEGEDTAGAYLFARNCSVCHTIGGLNDIADRVRGRSEEGIYVIIGRTEEMVPFMSPFAGTDRERRILAHFLYEVSQNRMQMQSRSRHVAEGWRQP